MSLQSQRERRAIGEWDGVLDGEAFTRVIMVGDQSSVIILEMSVVDTKSYDVEAEILDGDDIGLGEEVFEKLWRQELQKVG